MTPVLTLDDIVDHRAYEQERDALRAEVLDTKRRRRVPVGPIASFTFENRTTIRWQIQEMVRIERIMSDAGVQAEIDVYDPLIPRSGTLSATMFLELTDDDALREWLPRLVGVEAAVELRLGDGDELVRVPCVVDPDHARQLTRDETTASVHYVRFELSSDQVDRFGVGPVALAITHPEYLHETVLSDVTRAELLGDLQG